MSRRQRGTSHIVLVAWKKDGIGRRRQEKDRDRCMHGLEEGDRSGSWRKGANGAAGCPEICSIFIKNQTNFCSKITPSDISSGDF